MQHVQRFLAGGLVIASIVGVLPIACTDQTNDAFPIVPQDDVPDDEAPVGEAQAQAEGGKTRITDGSSVGPSTDPEREGDGGLMGVCADEFGDKLTAGFGRLDGIVYAVQKPSDTQCRFPNDDHVIVQVLMGGAVYRMVVNVQSDRVGQDPQVRYTVVPHALPSPPFFEGWHTGVSLDYVNTLATHNSAFTAFPLATLVMKLDDALKVGDRVAIYGQSGQGRPNSAHLVHRYGGNKDGAIVLSPTTSPKFLLFHFDEQVF